MSKLLKELIYNAKLQCRYSPDAETKVGCLLISRKHKTIIKASYNDFIHCKFREVLPNARPNKYFYIQHAEQILINKCARDGVSTNHCILISSHSPCPKCALALFQAGIDTIYCQEIRKETESINDRLDLKVTLKKLKSGFYKLKLSVR
jgi:dCMP deaminase